MNKKMVSLRLKDETIECIKEMCDETGLSQAEIIEKAIDFAYLVCRDRKEYGYQFDSAYIEGLFRSYYQSMYKVEK